jgi:hypothetical protein
MVDVIKLSLEKYAGIVSVLNQGGDAAGLVSDITSLKEVTVHLLSSPVLPPFPDITRPKHCLIQPVF